MNILGITVARTKKLEEDRTALVIAQASSFAEDMLISRLRDRKSEVRLLLGRAARAEAKDFLEEYGEQMLAGYLARAEEGRTDG